MDADLDAELSARALYQEAAEYCLTVKGLSEPGFVQVTLMNDEEGHVDFLETQIDLIKRIGVDRYTQAHIGGLGDGGSRRVSEVSG